MRVRILMVSLAGILMLGFGVVVAIGQPPIAPAPLPPTVTPAPAFLPPSVTGRPGTGVAPAADRARERTAGARGVSCGCFPVGVWMNSSLILVADGATAGLPP